MSSNFGKPIDAQKPSVVSPAAAAIISLVVPGLGQVLAGSFRKGLVLLASLTSIVALWYWRVRLVGRLEPTFPQAVSKSFYLQPILLVVAIGMIVTYLWIAYDAYVTAKRAQTTSGFVVWTLILFLFFFLGWQIGDIRPVALVRDAQDAGPFMMRILWPWDRAISRPEELLTGTVKVQTPCVEPVPELPQEVAGEPYISVTPTCGDLSKQSEATGTTLTLTGRNFAPNAETEIWWQDDMGNEFRQRQAGEYITVMTDENGAFAIDIIMPYRTIPQSDTREFALWELQARQVASLGAAEPSAELLISIEKMVETIFLGMMSTFFGIILSVPISFLAARNLMSTSWITLVIYYVVRAILNIIRSIEPLIWAVIAIIVVGLGPFAGIVALTVHTIASLGKLYSEAIESIDPGPIEAIQATGANWLQTVMFAVVPQIIPPFVSFTIYRWDINVRMSTVIGLVGGGGIGFVLIQWIRLLDYKAAGIAVWFIALTVTILDYVSAEIRARFV
ncbi:MAG: phosphonate ABC transporter, permease protein PhnE [Anaerolineales bacterium]|nr:phosphonate ABC transporter, permease protein PhnE [Anaerolineales bacterium]